MRFRFPRAFHGWRARFRPLHGWRAFYGEVGIIVLGVLIALGAEQAVQALHDDHVARETRGAVTEELDANLAYLQLREKVEPCVARRLSELHALVDQWGRTGTFTTPSWVAQAPRLNIDLPHYDAANSAGRLALLSREEQYRIGTVVRGLRAFDALEQAEMETWANLRLLQSGAAALSDNDRTLVREALQKAAYLDYVARLSIRQVVPGAESFGFRPDLRLFRENAPRIWKSGRYTPAICAPIDTPPAKANQMTGQLTPLPF